MECDKSGMRLVAAHWSQVPSSSVQKNKSSVDERKQELCNNLHGVEAVRP
jgi:hypothetical protein